MATLTGVQMTTAALADGTKVTAGTIHSPLYSCTDQVVIGADAAGSIYTMGKLPKGALFRYGILVFSVAQSTATFIIGITGNTNKYMKAVTQDSILPVLFGAGDE